MSGHVPNDPRDLFDGLVAASRKSQTVRLPSDRITAGHQAITLEEYRRREAKGEGDRCATCTELIGNVDTCDDLDGALVHWTCCPECRSDGGEVVEAGTPCTMPDSRLRNTPPSEHPVTPPTTAPELLPVCAPGRGVPDRREATPNHAHAACAGGTGEAGGRTSAPLTIGRPVPTTSRP